MRKLCLIVFYLIAVLCNSHAQHFKFMDITMDGSIEAFDEKLKEKGVVSRRMSVGDTKTDRFYDGKFYGNDVSLYVMATPKTNLVCTVNVSQYFETKEAAVEKYGYYCSLVETLYTIGKKTVNSDTDRMYTIGLGSIIMQIQDTDYKNYKYEVSLMYVDRINTTRYYKEEEDS